MKKERPLLRDARCESSLSLLTHPLSKWLKPWSEWADKHPVAKRFRVVAVEKFFDIP